ncbi:MAG: 4Fe-4S binding protein [Treponema sp.]|nr:4Fe-4S binding protein [Treponema sp.]
MVAAILFSLLFIMVTAAVLIFVLRIFYPSLSAQQVDLSEPLFSTEDSSSACAEEGLQASISRRAIVMCSPERILDGRRFKYTGARDCTMFDNIYGEEYGCSYGCLGFGTCTFSCPRNAIEISDGTAVITRICNGCGLCVEACPKHLIKLVPADIKECAQCAVPQGETAPCSECHKTRETPFPDQRHFQFWENFYKILTGK